MREKSGWLCYENMERVMENEYWTGTERTGNKTITKAKGEGDLDEGVGEDPGGMMRKEEGGLRLDATE
jgi:hypothetical protein